MPCATPGGQPFGDQPAGGQPFVDQPWADTADTTSPGRSGGLEPLQPDAPDVWHRVHPLTPFVRSWLLLVALVWGIGHTFVEDIVSALIKGEPISVDVGGAVQVVGAGLFIALLCGVLGLLIGLGLLSWWFTRYQITREHVRFRSGWFFRTQRQARLDRVQGIDIERKFLPRILGLAALKFDVADGGSSVLELSYLGRDHARLLRKQLLVASHEAADDALAVSRGQRTGDSAILAQGTVESAASADGSVVGQAGGTSGKVAASEGGALPTGGAAAHTAPWDSSGTAAAPAAGTGAVRGAPGEASIPPGAAVEEAGTASSSMPDRDGVDVRVARKYGLLTEKDELRQVFTVPTGRVLLSLVCSVPAVLLALVLVAAAVAWVVYPDALLVLVPTAVPMLLGVVSGLYGRLEKSWGFTLSEVPSGVRSRAGLFNERSSTIPTGRVQALEVTRPALWRIFGGHRVVVTTAGKGGAEAAEGLGSLVLPVGTAEQVRVILALLLPLPDDPEPLVTEGLDGVGDGGRFTTSPRRARWFDPVTWRRTGFAMDDSSLVLRRGRLSRHASVVPHHKTQSVALSQGPLERRLRLASFAVHVTAGSVTTSVDHLDVDRAREAQWRQSELARAARERVGAHRGNAGAVTSDTRGSDVAVDIPRAGGPVPLRP